MSGYVELLPNTPHFYEMASMVADENGQKSKRYLINTDGYFVEKVNPAKIKLVEDFSEKGFIVVLVSVVALVAGGFFLWKSNAGLDFKNTVIGLSSMGAFGVLSVGGCLAMVPAASIHYLNDAARLKALEKALEESYKDKEEQTAQQAKQNEAAKKAQAKLTQASTQTTPPANTQPASP